LELFVTRVFDAPRALVFKAWTEPHRIVQWWGPDGYTTPACDVDLRPDGVWRLCMLAPDGRERWLRCVYREIVEPERLVCSWCWEGPQETLPDWLPGGKAGHETVLTVTFAEYAGGKTKLTLHQAVFESVPARDAHDEGWVSGLERLNAYLNAQGKKEDA
jgi:uncharacterized protein YndB with AHSA1/START domain